MSVESEILRIQHNIANTYAMVSEKGGKVPLQPTSDNLATAVNSIPQTLGEVYSTEETRIGTWVDGKPLYRMAVSIISPPTALTNKVYPLEASVGTMVRLQAVLQSQVSVSTSKYPLPFLYEENVYLSVWYSSGSLYARAGRDAVEYLNQPVSVILEYTKTTD